MEGTYAKAGKKPAARMMSQTVFIPEERTVNLHSDVLSFARSEVAVVDAICDGGRRRRDPGGEHRYVDGGDGFERRFEIAGTKALGDQERRPAVFILGVPHFDFGSVRGEEFDGLGKVFVSRGVHGCFTVFVDGVDV